MVQVQGPELLQMNPYYVSWVNMNSDKWWRGIGRGWWVKVHLSLWLSDWMPFVIDMSHIHTVVVVGVNKIGICRRNCDRYKVTIWRGKKLEMEWRTNGTIFLYKDAMFHLQFNSVSNWPSDFFLLCLREANLAWMHNGFKCARCVGEWRLVIIN